MNPASNEIVQDLRWASPGWPLWWLAIVILLAGLLVGAAVFYFLRRRRELAQSARMAGPPAHESALAALARLRALLTEDNYLQFIIEVSRILRVYIQDRYGLRAPHRSTDEFLAEAQQSDALSLEHQELLAEFLRRCDLVKFARRHVVLAQMNELFATAQHFVEETMVKAETGEEVAAVAHA